MPRRLQTLLETIARDTWRRLRDSRLLEIRFGEETITDLLLLEMKRQDDPRSQVVHTPIKKEAKQGTDWEWWIGSDRIGWLRYAVQAKRCDKTSGRYGSLAHTVGGVSQFELLSDYAERNSAIGLYCFYNYPQPDMSPKAWNCQYEFEEKQLACTVTPLSVAKTALTTRGCRTFQWMHSQKQTVPLRCLAACPKIRQAREAVMSDTPGERIHPLFGSHYIVYPNLPQEIREGRSSGRIDKFSPNAYDTELAIYPRRIVVSETDSSDEGRNV